MYSPAVIYRLVFELSCVDRVLLGLRFAIPIVYSYSDDTGSGSFYEQSCRCLGDQLDAARALASQIADRSDIRYGMACVTTFGDFAEHAPHEL